MNKKEELDYCNPNDIVKTEGNEEVEPFEDHDIFLGYMDDAVNPPTPRVGATESQRKGTNGNILSVNT